MKYNKETLEKLLLLIEEICNDKDNDWFTKELNQKFGTSSKFEDFPGFLLFLKKSYKVKAKEFYKNINDKSLKNELIKDNVEMQWYQTTHDVERFLLFTFYQVENLLNYYCINSDAFSKIQKDKNKYQHSFGPKFSIVCHDCFFDRKTGEPKPIEKVSPIYSKIVFWMYDSDRMNWYKSNHKNMSNLINIRNKTSHRSSTSQPNENVLKTIEFLTRQDFSSLSFYINILRELVKSIDEIGKVKVAIQPLEKESTSKGLKILGKIEL